MSESETFRRHLIRLRHERGLSAAELSKMAGLNARGVKDIEEGRSQSPKLSTVFALARALNTDPGEMIGLGPRVSLSAELAAFLAPYSEEDQARFLAVLRAVALPSGE